ncbi:MULTISPECIES: helix-turn-helix domain-containing protein [unclassified Clostridium]|uniref:helix-turn-helix domain-containing protein n=1 Tax=unclassified Clostridium TaxID=2614128 RepID=UPI0025B9369A|nr:MULTISPECIES: helix-turn-helix transcriptional regulator [unclassified Clostridium]
MNLKELIEEKGMTMYRVAKEGNIGQSTVNEIANGKREHIELGTAVKIAKVLNVDVEEIYKCIGGKLNAN